MSESRSCPSQDQFTLFLFSKFQTLLCYMPNLDPTLLHAQFYDQHLCMNILEGFQHNCVRENFVLESYVLCDDYRQMQCRIYHCAQVCLSTGPLLGRGPHLLGKKKFMMNFSKVKTKSKCFSYKKKKKVTRNNYS